MPKIQEKCQMLFLTKELKINIKMFSSSKVTRDGESGKQVLAMRAPWNSQLDA